MMSNSRVLLMFLPSEMSLLLPSAVDVCVVDFCGGHLLMVLLLKSVDVFATSTHCPFAKI